MLHDPPHKQHQLAMIMAHLRLNRYHNTKYPQEMQRLHPFCPPFSNYTPAILV